MKKFTNSKECNDYLKGKAKQGETVVLDERNCFPYGTNMEDVKEQLLKEWCKKWLQKKVTGRCIAELKDIINHGAYRLDLNSQQTDGQGLGLVKSKVGGEWSSSADIVTDVSDLSQKGIKQVADNSVRSIAIDDSKGVRDETKQSVNNPSDNPIQTRIKELRRKIEEDREYTKFEYNCDDGTLKSLFFEGEISGITFAQQEMIKIIDEIVIKPRPNSTTKFTPYIYYEQLKQRLEK